MKRKHRAADRDGWETLKSETHFESDHLTVVTEDVRGPDCPKTRSWTVVYRKAAVVVAPMTADGELILICQERIPIRSSLWELPAGQIDDEGGDEISRAQRVALRELREETGYELAPAGELVSLGDFFSSPGFTNEHAYLFLARPVELSADGPAHDESESISDCRSFSPVEIAQMVETNIIRDANTLAVCARLLARGLLSLRG
ncbi:MAG: NUDIX hydrolase [Chthoniobacterales bacterium]